MVMKGRVFFLKGEVVKEKKRRIEREKEETMGVYTDRSLTTVVLPKNEKLKKTTDQLFGSHAFDFVQEHNGTIPHSIYPSTLTKGR